MCWCPQKETRRACQIPQNWSYRYPLPTWYPADKKPGGPILSFNTLGL